MTETDSAIPGKRPIVQQIAIGATLALVVIVLFESCSGEGDTDAPSAFTVEPKAIGGLGNYAGAIAEGATPDSLEKAARAVCEGQTHCSVYGWRDASQAASAMPMLEREQAALDFSYTLNRSTGLERVLWNCGVWQGAGDVCLAKPEAAQGAE